MSQFIASVNMLLAAVWLIAGCGSNSPAAPEINTTKNETAPVKVTHASWQAHAGEESYEGEIAFVNRTDGKLHLQLVNQDAVNLAMLFPETGEGERKVEDAFFALGRKQPCRLVASEPPYQVTLTPGGVESLNGTFAGTLGCPDYSALEVKGSFQISVDGEQR